MFYLTLPSNSSLKFFPDNHPSHFFTKLPQPQELDGEYEVGLAELQFTNSYQNVKKGEVYFDYESHEPALDPNIRHLRHCIRANVSDGLYESSKYFISALNKLVDSFLDVFGSTKENPAVKFYFNPATRRASISKFQENTTLRLSPKLVEILAMPDWEMHGTGKFAGAAVMDVDQSLKSLFIYTDLVQPRPVGDSVVPLLRTLPPVNKEKDTMHYLFEKPHYIPLARFQFDSVEILLTNDRGVPLPFDGGHSIVTLHFRRRRTS